jgi:hypothetical protein
MKNEIENILTTVKEKNMKLLLLFLFPLSLMAQDSIKVPYSEHYIQSVDSLTEKTVKDWIAYMEVQPVYYERAMKKVKGFKIIPEERRFVSDFKDGYIILNERLNEFPYCKKAAIYYELYKHTGGKIDKTVRTLAVSKFQISKRTNELFKKQLEDEYMLRVLTRKLK